MRAETLTALLSIGLASLAVPRASAAETATVAPQMYSGHSHRQPERWTASPAANQIGASDVIGADVENAGGTTIAKIADLIIDPHTATAGIAIITPAGSRPFDHGKDSAIAWSSLKFKPTPTPHFATKLDPAALDAGSELLAKASSNSSYLDAKRELLGKEVVGRDSDPIGHVEDLVVTFGTGRLVGLVINTGGFISMGGANNHVVSWDAAQPRVGAGGGPIRLALSRGQIEQAPVTTTMAPAPIGPKPGTQNSEVKRDVTGNISGTKIPAPQNRR